MQRRRTTANCLGLAVVLAVVWSAVDGSGVRTGDRIFVFDAAAGRGYVTTVVAGESCPLVGIPVAEVPVRRSACGRVASSCADSAGTAGRSCGTRTGSCFYFPLGHTTLNTVGSLDLADEGSAPGRAEVQNRPVISRSIRPPIPPPRTA